MNQSTEPANQKFDQWCLVEIMGHQRIVGKVTEAVLAGGAFLRVDVPSFNGEPAFTRFYSPGSIYCISPISETVARGLMASCRNEPVSRFELPQLAEKVSGRDESHEDRDPQQTEGEDPEANDEHAFCHDCGQFINDCTCP